MRSIEQLFEEGNHCMAAGDAAGAQAAYEAALELDPGQAAVHGNLALLLDNTGQFTAAEDHYRKALTLAPDTTQLWVNFGAMLLQRQRLEEAEAALRKALALDAGNLSTLSNLGAALALQQREDEAEGLYRKALGLDPTHRKSAFNLAYLLLKQGRFEEGWQRLESRDWYGLLADKLPFPRWQGQGLAGQSILITLEAGHGDMIQFCRYAAQLKAAGARRVGVLCHPALAELFKTLDGCDLAISIDQNLPDDDFDFWVPPLSLPFQFGTRLDSIPAKLPYLHADPGRITRFAKALEAPPGTLKVGLVWKGSPNFENDAHRSLPSLATLAPLSEVPNVHFHSLQKGQGEDEVFAQNFTRLGPELHNFADTAAVIAQLDLVIAVDTAVAHLAGALGKPCWVLLPWYLTDWRWLQDRDDSPWYPGAMRLFRQPKMGDWEPVIAQVVDALKALKLSRP
jgi:tetratricopeptide (TPR) repeat protein